MIIRILEAIGIYLVMFAAWTMIMWAFIGYQKSRKTERK